MMGSGGMWLWMILGLVALWVLVAYIVLWAIGPRRTRPKSDPRRALDARLARGEITSKAYRRARDLLGKRD